MQNNKSFTHLYVVSLNVDSMIFPQKKNTKRKEK